jgi:hypothetical protein
MMTVHYYDRAFVLKDEFDRAHGGTPIRVSFG